MVTVGDGEPAVELAEGTTALNEVLDVTPGPRLDAWRIETTVFTARSLSSRRKAAISLAVESVCAHAKGVNAKPAATSAGNKQAALVIAPPSAIQRSLFGNF